MSESKKKRMKILNELKQEGMVANYYWQVSSYQQSENY